MLEVKSDTVCGGPQLKLSKFKHADSSMMQMIVIKQKRKKRRQQCWYLVEVISYSIHEQYLTVVEIGSKSLGRFAPFPYIPSVAFKYRLNAAE